MPEFTFNLPIAEIEVATAAVEQLTQIAQMLDRLPEQFRRRGDTANKIEKFLTAVGGSIQDLYDVMQDVLTNRSVDTGVGSTLDDIGSLVGEPRSGFDDDTYRRRLRARISVHKSKGTVEDLIRVTKLIINDSDAKFVVEPQSVATVVVRIEGVSVSDDLADDVLFDFLQATVAAGVRVILESGTDEPENWFSLDDAPGLGLDAGSLIDSRG